MKKTFFFILSIFVIQGTFAQESILVEHFNYNQDSSKYELEKTSLRTYDEGVEPLLNFDSYYYHPLTPKDPYDNITYMFENTKEVHEKYTGEGYSWKPGTFYYEYRYEFSFEGDTVLKIVKTRDYGIGENGDTISNNPETPRDSLLFVWEEDSKYIGEKMYDYTYTKCELYEEFYFNENNQWTSSYSSVECDSIVGDTLFGHDYSQEDTSFTKTILDSQNRVIQRAVFFSTTESGYNKEIVNNVFLDDSIETNYERYTDDSITYSKSFKRDYSPYDEKWDAIEYYEDGSFKKTVSNSTIRLFFENYSLGYDIDYTTKEVSKSDSIVIHYNYVVAAAQEKVFHNEMITVFPNPSTGTVNIHIEDNSSFTAEIFDIQGRAIRKEEGVGELQLSNIEKGSYVIKLITSQGVSTQRVEVVE